MKLHRLVLTNYRGITHREIEFPDRGVVVVSGANEIGKSSMIEALDLLLNSKDRSNKKDVKQVKPTHADVGAEITAEISTGPYRFIYHKRFHKRCETQLTVLAPRREQLTDNLSRLTGEGGDAGKRLSGAGPAAEAVAALPHQLKKAEVVAPATDATHAASVAALTERRRLRADVDERTAAIAGLEAAAAEALDELTTATEVQEAAEAAAGEARAAVEASQARVDAARRAVQQVADPDEAN